MEEKPIPHFFKEIKDRSKLQLFPFNDLYFSYLIFFVLIIGGVGIWISLYQEFKSETFSHINIVLNIGTYYLVLITTSYIDITTNEKIINKKSLQIYSFILLFLIIAVFTLSFILPKTYSIISSIIGVVIALFIWHLANCDNDKFNDESYSSKIRSEAKNIHGNNWGDE